MIESSLENAVLDQQKFYDMKCKDFIEEINLTCKSLKDQAKLKVNNLLSNNEIERNEVQDCLAEEVPLSRYLPPASKSGHNCYFSEYMLLTLNIFINFSHN